MSRSRPWILRLRFAPAVLYYGVIFYLSSRSRFPFRAPFAAFDKIVHFAEFAVLGALLLWGFSFAERLSPRLQTRAALLLAAAGGVADEIHQLFVPGRNADAGDALADALGAAVGILIFSLARRRRKRGGETRRGSSRTD